MWIMEYEIEYDIVPRKRIELQIIENNIAQKISKQSELKIDNRMKETQRIKKKNMWCEYCMIQLWIYRNHKGENPLFQLNWFSMPLKFLSIRTAVSDQSEMNLFNLIKTLSTSMLCTLFQGGSVNQKSRMIFTEMKLACVYVVISLCMPVRTIFGHSTFLLIREIFYPD